MCFSYYVNNFYQLFSSHGRKHPPYPHPITGSLELSGHGVELLEIFPAHII